MFRLDRTLIIEAFSLASVTSSRPSPWGEGHRRTRLAFLRYWKKAKSRCGRYKRSLKIHCTAPSPNGEGDGGWGKSETERNFRNISSSIVEGPGMRSNSNNQHLNFAIQLVSKYWICTAQSFYIITVAAGNDMVVCIEYGQAAKCHGAIIAFIVAQNRLMEKHISSFTIYLSAVEHGLHNGGHCAAANPQRWRN